MKNKSLLLQIVLLISLAFLGIVLTMSLALFAGSMDNSIWDFENLNIANMIPVFFFGGLITCFGVAIMLLFTSRAIFYKLKDFFENEIHKTDDNK